jgi:hypothetical protein
MLLSSIILAGLVWEFGFVNRTRSELDQLVETQQGVRAALSAISQEMRQAGACLPRTGDMVALTGSNSGARDELTLRIGKVEVDDLVCIRTVLSAKALKGTTSVKVQDGSGFEVGELVYLRGASGTGRNFEIVGTNSNTISLDEPLDAEYLAGSGLYAIEERTYAIDSEVDPPILTVAIDGGDPSPLVHGVERFDVTYLTAPCPPCEAINAPPDGHEDWLLVREVEIEVTVRARRPSRDGEYARLTSRTHVAPRNLL